MPKWQSVIRNASLTSQGSIELIKEGRNMNQTIGRQFPDFEMVDHESQRVKLSQYAGKFPLIVSFYRGYW